MIVRSEQGSISGFQPIGDLPCRTSAHTSIPRRPRPSSRRTGRRTRRRTIARGPFSMGAVWKPCATPAAGCSSTALRPLGSAHRRCLIWPRSMRGSPSERDGRRYRSPDFFRPRSSSPAWPSGDSRRPSPCAPWRSSTTSRNPTSFTTSSATFRCTHIPFSRTSSSALGSPPRRHARNHRWRPWRASSGSPWSSASCTRTTP